MEEWITPEFVSGLVSVIIPTYNRAELVVEAIDSLRAQTWKSLEVVVVDDGSEDDTLSLLRDVPGLGDGRTLRIIEQPNTGVSTARNRGTQASTGEFIIYLDSDDTLVPDAIEHYVEVMRRSDSDYCYAQIDSVDRLGCRLEDVIHWHPKPFAPGDIMTNMWQPQGACYLRSAVNLAGPWNTDLVGGEDHEFILRIKMTGRGTLLPRVQGYYRNHGDNQLHKQYAMGQNYDHELAVIEIFVGWLMKRAPARKDIFRTLVDRCRFIAFRMGATGDIETKNRALIQMGRLLAGSCSLKRFYVLGRWVNFTPFYSGIANFKRLLTA